MNRLLDEAIGPNSPIHTMRVFPKLEETQALHDSVPYEIHKIEFQSQPIYPCRQTLLHSDFNCYMTVDPKYVHETELNTGPYLVYDSKFCCLAECDNPAIVEFVKAHCVNGFISPRGFLLLCHEMRVPTTIEIYKYVCDKWRLVVENNYPDKAIGAEHCPSEDELYLYRYIRTTYSKRD